MSTLRHDATTRGTPAGKKTLRRLMQYRDVKNKHFAEATGMHLNTVQGYTGGPTALTLDVLDAFAPVLGVPRHVLAMDEDEALRWVIDHAPNGSLAATAGTITTRRYSASDQDELPFPPDVIDLRDCVTGRGAAVTGRATVTGFGLGPKAAA